jgi:hypothetical protein
MDTLQAMKKIDALISEFDQEQQARFEKRRESLNKSLNYYADEGTLALVKTIQPMRIKKGSVLAQFGAVEPIDLAAEGPGDLLAGRNASTEAFARAISDMYPTLPEMRAIVRPSPEPLPWDLPDTWTDLEERYRQAAGLPDPGPSHSIPSVLGMKVAKGGAAIAHLAKAVELCKAHYGMATDLHKSHLANVRALDDAHQAGVDGAPSLAALKAMVKSHGAHMDKIQKSHFQHMAELCKLHHDAMAECLSKALAACAPVN